MQVCYIVGTGKTSRSYSGNIPMDTVNIESPSVQSYISILQAVINRMAANSAGCKTWCITLVSATIIIIATTIEKPNYLWIALIPILFFFFLDSYYLGLERRFRAEYNDFIRKLHSNSVTINDLFMVTPEAGAGMTFLSTLGACTSISVWLFYGVLGVMLAAVRVWIL